MARGDQNPTGDPSISRRPPHIRVASTPETGMAVTPSIACPTKRNTSCGKIPNRTQRAASTTWGTIMDIGTSWIPRLSSALPRKTDAEHLQEGSERGERNEQRYQAQHQEQGEAHSCQ